MMSDESIHRKIVATLVDEFELDAGQVQPEATLFDDLDLDSLDAVDMVLVLEKQFGMKLTDEAAIQAVETVADLGRLIRAQLEEKQGSNG